MPIARQSGTTGLVWFRNDLRLEDNPAWAAATRAHQRVVPVHVRAPSDQPGSRADGVRLDALRELDWELLQEGGRLFVVEGDPGEVVPALVEEFGATAVHWNRAVDPDGIQQERAVQEAISVEHVAWFGTLVHSPDDVRTVAGGGYRVFEAFHRRWKQTPWPEWPEPGRAVISSHPGGGVPDNPRPSRIRVGAEAAHDRLEEAARHAAEYDEARSGVGLRTTSQLSIDLALGTISPRTVIRRLDPEQAASFIRQLAWRDFHAHALFHDPDAAHTPFDRRYTRLAWQDDPEGFEAWTKGQTGYPIVDAAMRQLAHEGWMHGRLRMVVASFLTKHLLIDWRLGERWFRQHLLDADPAQNIGNWQWTAGVGFDNAPYVRVLNPVLQSRKLDPAGTFIRRWIPELAEVRGSEVHEPWRAANPVPGYPPPIVDHDEARRKALAVFGNAKQPAGK